jgi:hypothetical protein
VGAFLANYNSEPFLTFMERHMPAQLELDDMFELVAAAGMSLVSNREWRKQLLVPFLEQHLPATNRLSIESLERRGYFRGLHGLGVKEDRFWETHLGRFTASGVKGAKRLVAWAQYGVLSEEYLEEMRGYLGADPDVAWRFNLAENRLYTNQEMAAKSQLNIPAPEPNSLLEPEEREEAHARYHEILEKGEQIDREDEERRNAKTMLSMIEDKFYRVATSKGDVTSNIFDPDFLKKIGLTPEDIASLPQINAEDLE